MERSKFYRGFIIGWQDPPLTSAGWDVNVGSNDPMLFRLPAERGFSAFLSPTSAEGIARVKLAIDAALIR
jgi:hypothetical protein